MSHSIERLMIAVGDVTFALAPTEHVHELKTVITQHARSGGGFLDVTIDDGQQISILITPTSTVTIAAKTVHLDTHIADGGSREAWEPGGSILFDGDIPYDII